MAEDKVLNLITQHNKPFNTQSVADLLATQGVKKTAAQKALDALAEAGKIVAKVCPIAHRRRESNRSLFRPTHPPAWQHVPS
jgi:predicted GNAT family acetyltransferase